MDGAELLMRGTLARCPDCSEERLLVPVDGARDEYCCTGCDAGVVLLDRVERVPVPVRRAS